jgi:hypothetical protein
MTVTTLGQTIWRGADGAGCELMGEVPVAAAMSLKMLAQASNSACSGSKKA